MAESDSTEKNETDTKICGKREAEDEAEFVSKRPTTEVIENEEPCGTNESKTFGSEFSSRVAEHYNTLQNLGLDERKQSNIFYLRNFNNWVKSVLINVYESKMDHIDCVLDLCCGKGGDLHKWMRLKIKHLICADIACKSIEQCEARYNDMCKKMSNMFTCEFITADCTRVCLREKFKNPETQFDLVSCQFSLHYSFESLPQAECMLKNASECLKPGGYFIGTMPDANQILKKTKSSDTKNFKNNVLSIELLGPGDRYPLFGAQYDFHLDSVVQCPEFLVHFPTLVKLASKFGFVLDYKENFTNFYDNNIGDKTKKSLLKKMLALEPYSSQDDNKDKSEAEYGHAEKYCSDNQYSGVLGTLSKSEWDVISLYQVFAFKKVADSRSVAS